MRGACPHDYGVIFRNLFLSLQPRDQGDRSLIFFSKLVTGTGAWVYPDACPRDYLNQGTLPLLSEDFLEPGV